MTRFDAAALGPVDLWTAAARLPTSPTRPATTANTSGQLEKLPTHDLSVSTNKVGDVQVAQGELKGSLKSFRDSLAIRERLAQADPDNAGWQRDLAVSHSKVGSLLNKSGKSAEALARLRQVHAIMARLTKWRRSNAVWQNDLRWIEGQISALEKR